MPEAAHDAKHIPGDRHLILGLICVMAAIAYIQRAAISVPINEIATDLKIKDLAWDMGLVQSTWYFSYALMQIPSGWFADRFGSRLSLVILSIMWSIATFLCCFATGFWSLVILWGVMGAAQAGAFPSAAKAIGQLFPNAERARASGLLASGMAIGGAISPILTGFLLRSIQPMAMTLEIARWRLLLASYAIPGIVWGLIFCVLVSSSRLPVVGRQSVAPPSFDWTRLLRSGSLALLCAQQFFRAAGLVFLLTWFPKFLQQVHGVTAETSGTLTSIAGIGGIIGSLTGGFFSDWALARTGNTRLSRQGIAVAGMAGSALLLLTSYFLQDVTVRITLQTLGVFCATFGGVSGYTVAIEFGGKRVATVLSAMNMCGNIGAALFPIVAGWLVNRTGDWNLLMLLFAGIMAIDTVCWALLNPKGTLFGDEESCESR